MAWRGGAFPGRRGRAGAQARAAGDPALVRDVDPGRIPAGSQQPRRRRGPEKVGAGGRRRAPRPAVRSAIAGGADCGLRAIGRAEVSLLSLPRDPSRPRPVPPGLGCGGLRVAPLWGLRPSRVRKERPASGRKRRRGGAKRRGRRVALHLCVFVRLPFTADWHPLCRRGLGWKTPAVGPGSALESAPSAR